MNDLDAILALIGHYEAATTDSDWEPVAIKIADAAPALVAELETTRAMYAVLNESAQATAQRAAASSRRIVYLEEELEATRRDREEYQHLATVLEDRVKRAERELEATRSAFSDLVSRDEAEFNTKSSVTRTLGPVQVASEDAQRSMPDV